MKVGVIGGGIFGLYCAKSLLEHNFEVDIFEQGSHLGYGASKVNQARLHLGYHYPRSKETALQCIEGFEKFNFEFPTAINKNFKKYYAISKEKTKVSGQEYIKFCEDLNLPYKIVKLDENIIRSEAVDVVIDVPEFTFDWEIIVDSLEKYIIKKNGNIFLNHKIIGGDVVGDVKKIIFCYGDIIDTKEYDVIINATYSNINGLNGLFGLPKLPLSFEMCEMVKVRVPEKYNSLGITIMDGNFTSIMPFGLSGYQTISNVALTPHERSDSLIPLFSCNNENIHCNAKNINVCSYCEYKLSSNSNEMLEFASYYIPYVNKVKVVEPMFTVKTILNYVENTDARPSQVYSFQEALNYFVIFSGKIDTVIDISNQIIMNLKHNKEPALVKEL